LTGFSFTVIGFDICAFGSAIQALAAFLAILLAPTLLLTMSWLNADLNSKFSKKETSSSSAFSSSRLVSFLLLEFLKMTKLFFFFLSLVNLWTSLTQSSQSFSNIRRLLRSVAFKRGEDIFNAFMSLLGLVDA